MEMPNATCLPFQPYHYSGLEAASVLPQNLVALSLFMSSLKCDCQSNDGVPNRSDFAESENLFEYMKEPIAKLTDPTESSEKLVRFTEKEFLSKEIVAVGRNIHVAIGYALANSIMIEGKDGVVIIDTTENDKAMMEIMKEFRRITKKPVKAVVLTHFHTDHILGTNAIIESEKMLWPEVKVDIIAHESILEQMHQFAATYGIGYKRGYRQFGVLMPKILGAITGSGIGPRFLLEKTTRVHIPLPTLTYSGRKTYHIAGLEFDLIHTPGETNDQTTVWLPSEQAVFPADNIYKAFPNLYAIRGSPARDAKMWYTSLDIARELGAQYLVGSHGQPVIGKQTIYDTLLAYRDAIKYVHDQTLRLLNKGRLPSQIVEEIKLPDRLANHAFLQEHYGTIEWSIRGIYTNYLGWFSGDPKDLHPMTELSRARKMLQLISEASEGNPLPANEIMLRHAQLSHIKSYNTYLRTGKRDVDEDKWALEIVDLLLESNTLNESLADTATHIKVSALRAIGSEEVSANGRNYYITYAMEVESRQPHFIDPTGTKRHAIRTSPVKRVLNGMCGKVSGLQCQHENHTVSYSFADTKESYTMTLRNSVCDLYPSVDKSNSISLSTTTDIFKQVIAGDIDLNDQVEGGKIVFKSGTALSFKIFLSCFDRD